MRNLSFTIPGRLGSWQRADRNASLGSSFSYTPAKMRADQGMVRHFAMMAMRESCKEPLVGALGLLVNAWRQPPKSWSVKKQERTTWITSKPDFDNTLKLIADALNKVAYDDDAQIADGRLCKRYSLNPECVTVELWELGE